MSKYTPEQVESHIACLDARDMHAEAGMLRDYADLLREHESAKAGVTDEMCIKALDVYLDTPVVGGLSIRPALEAVAPMLASAQSGTGTDKEIEYTLSGLIQAGKTASDPNQGTVGWHMRSLIRQMVPYLRELELAKSAQPNAVPDGYAITFVREGLIRISETTGTKEYPGQSSLVDQSRYPVDYGLLKAMLATATQSEAGS